MSVKPHPTIEGAYQIDWLEPDTTKPVRKNGRHPLKRKYETYHGTRTDAEKRFAELCQLHINLKQQSVNPTINEKYTEYLTHIELHKSKNYYNSIVWAFKKLKPHFGRYPVSHLTETIFNDFKKAHRDTPAHTNQCIDYLKIMISWMVQRHYAHPLPFKIEKLQHFRNIPEPPNPGEFETFMTQVRHGLQKEGISKEERKTKELLVMLIYETGIRWIEARHLCWEHLHTDGRLYLGRTKTGEARYTVLPAYLMEQLEPMRQKKGFIFINPKTKAPYSTLRKLIQGARERSGITIKGTHGLRHAMGTDMTEVSDDLRATQVALGHATIKTTAKYAHVGTDRLRKHLERTRLWRKGKISSTDKNTSDNNP